MSQAQTTSARQRGREIAVLTLCHLEGRPADERGEAVGLLWDNPPEHELELDAYGNPIPGSAGTLATLLVDGAARGRAQALMDAAIERWADIDQAIESASKRWRLARMDRVDRNVLRVCALELQLAEEQTPPAVAVAEAVRLATRYGSDRSGPFVNGVAQSLLEAITA